MNTNELNIERPGELEKYLRAAGRIGVDETIQVRVLAGGVSNRTVWVRHASGETWVVKQALAKLRVKVDWYSDPARIQREAMGLRWLKQIGASTPALKFEDAANHLLAMEAVPEPHENWKDRLLLGQVEQDVVRQFAELLGLIHRRGWELRDQAADLFDDRSFFESLRVEPYYLYSAKQEPRAGQFLQRLVDETRDMRLSVVHGDYSPKNILIHCGRVVLLDHEVIHFGDPAFDVGFAMAHFLSKAHHLASRRHQFHEAAMIFWTTYLHALGDVPWSADLEERAAWHTLGCLLARVAGRSQLEYLSEQERQRQREAVVQMMRKGGYESLPALGSDFLGRLQ